MVERALLIVEAEEQRADQRFFFEVAKSAHNAIRRALFLDFLHARALFVLIRQVVSFCDYAIEAHPLVKPLPRYSKIFGHRRESYAAFFSNFLAKESLQLLATVAQSAVHQFPSSRIHQQIEHNKQARRRPAKLFNAARGRMDAHQKIVKRQASVDGNYDFAVEDKLLCANLSKSSH